MLKISKLICGTLIAVSMVSVPKPSAADASATASDDKASIEALVMRFRDAFIARDADALMQAYAPGNRLFVFDVTPPRQHAGWQDYKKDWQELFAAFPGPITYSISDFSITVLDSVAYSHRIEQGQFTRKDGSKMDLVVRVTDVYRKLKGQWLIVRNMCRCRSISTLKSRISYRNRRPGWLAGMPVPVHLRAVHVEIGLLQGGAE